MKGTTMVQDIVCGMRVEENDPRTIVKTIRGRQLFFCSADCMLLFTRDIEYYITRTLGVREIAKDLVCGMEVDKGNPPFITQHEEQAYYFCSYECRMEFQRNPEQYIKP
jgi:YHS domain-containing protein